MRTNLIIMMLPLYSFSQRLVVDDYVTAFDDIAAFKKSFFLSYPLNSEIEPQQLTLVEYEYVLYQTLSSKAPYILIADEAISIGISNELAMRLRDDFLDYFEENCKANSKYKPEIGRFTEWYCGGTSFSTIQGPEITMLYIKNVPQHLQGPLGFNVDIEGYN